MSESILDLESGPQRPQLCPKSPACGGISRKRARSRAQDSQRDPVDVTAKGQEEKNPLPQHQPSRAWSVLSLPQGSVKFVSFVLFLLGTLAIFISSFHLPYSLWSHMKSPKGTNVQFHCLPRFSTSDGSLALWPHLLVLPTQVYT